MWNLGSLIGINQKAAENVENGLPERVEPAKLDPDNLAGTIDSSEYARVQVSATARNTEHAEFDIPQYADVLTPCAFSIVVSSPSVEKNNWANWLAESLKDYGDLRFTCISSVETEIPGLKNQVVHRLLFGLNLNLELIDLFRLHLADVAIIFGVRNIALSSGRSNY